MLLWVLTSIYGIELLTDNLVTSEATNDESID